MTGLQTPAAIEGAYSEKTGATFLALLTLRHPQFSASHRFVNDRVNIVSQGDTYLALPFQVIRPAENDRDPEARIRVANVDSRLGSESLRIFGPVEVDMQVVLASSPGLIERAWTDFEMIRVTFNAQFLEGTLTQRQYSQRPWPPRRMTPSGFRWIARQY